jgi:hypothetical protein
VRRRALAAVALVLLAGACTDPEDRGAVPTTGTTARSTDGTTPGDPATARLAPLLLRVHDLSDPRYEPEVSGRRFTAQDAARIRICDEDLRTEWGVVDGRQSRFSDGEVEITHTVTAGGDVTGFLARLEDLAATCRQPWTEPALAVGGGPVEREITGTYPPPDVGVDGTGLIIRSHNQLGATDTIVIVLVDGALASSLSVSGPIGADFSVVDEAIRAAARRLRTAPA